MVHSRSHHDSSAKPLMSLESNGAAAAGSGRPRFAVRGHASAAGRTGPWRRRSLAGRPCFPPSCKLPRDAARWRGGGNWKTSRGFSCGMNQDLLDLLVCPEDHSRLHFRRAAGPVHKLNAAIAAGKLKNRGGAAVNRPDRSGARPRRRQAGLSGDRRHSAHADRRSDSAGSIAVVSVPPVTASPNEKPS